MPSINRQLPEGYEAISRPVARGIVDSVIKHLGLENRVYVQFNGDIDAAPQAGSTLDSKNKESGADPRMGATQKLIVSLREDFIPQEVLATPVHQKNSAEIFIDADLDIVIKPVYHMVKGVLSFNCRFPDKPSAEQWLKRQVRYISQNRAEMYHEIEYEYPLPEQYLSILQEIHRLRENVAGYGESLSDYLAMHFTSRATGISMLNGKQATFCIREAQKGVLGWFDWEIPPNEEKADVGATYTAQFDFHYEYSQVTAVNLKYPIIVHQQLLDEKFIQRNTPYEMERRPTYMSMAQRYYEANRGYHGGYLETMEGVVFPDYDEWIPSITPKSSTKIMSLLCTVDPADPRLVLNINDLVHWDMNPDVLAYLLTTRRYVTASHFSPIVLSLYRDRTPIDEQTVFLDANGDFRTTFDMDMRNQYHFVMYAMNDLSMLSREQETTLRNNPAACLTILKSLDSRLEANGLLPEVIGNRLVSRLGYQRAVEAIRTTNTHYAGAPTQGRYTVGTYFIAVNRKDNSNANR